MDRHAATLADHIERAREHDPIRLAVVAADQDAVLQTVHEATELGLVEARLIGEPDAIAKYAQKEGLDIDETSIVPAGDAADAAARASRSLQATMQTPS